MSARLHYADLATLLARIGYRENPAAYHGALCGALCREKPGAIDPPGLFEDQDLQPDAEARAQLRQARDQALDSLADVEAGFSPLLPDDETALADRARALAAWCDGFLYGLSALKPLPIRDCSEEVREVIKDFTQFTHAALHSGDDPEVEETAYAELVEYIRVGAQLIYMELHPRPPSVVDDGRSSPTVH